MLTPHVKSPRRSAPRSKPDRNEADARAGVDTDSSTKRSGKATDIDAPVVETSLEQKHTHNALTAKHGSVRFSFFYALFRLINVGKTLLTLYNFM